MNTFRENYELINEIYDSMVNEASLYHREKLTDDIKDLRAILAKCLLSSNTSDDETFSIIADSCDNIAALLCFFKKMYINNIDYSLIILSKIAIRKKSYSIAYYLLNMLLKKHDTPIIKSLFSESKKLLGLNLIKNIDFKNAIRFIDKSDLDIFNYSFLLYYHRKKNTNIEIFDCDQLPENIVQLICIMSDWF